MSLDATSKPIEGEADSDFKESEIVPFRYEGGIDRFIEQEVWPYAPGTWVNSQKTTVGYKIIFSKYFYRPAPVRDIRDIVNELNELEKEFSLKNCRKVKHPYLNTEPHGKIA